MSDFPRIEAEPAYLRRSRKSTRHPKSQYSLRSVFSATFVVALLSLAVREASGRAVLDFVPMFGALLTIGALVALLASLMRANGVAIGGLAAVTTLGALAAFPIWMHQGVDEALREETVNWDRVRLGSDVLLPFTGWLLGFAAVGCLGGAIGCAVKPMQRQGRRRDFHDGFGSVDSLSFPRIRKVVKQPRAWSAERLCIGLTILACGCGVLLGREDADSFQVIDVACWLAAMAAVGFFLVLLRQITGSDPAPVGGGVVVSSFALVTTIPIWGCHYFSDQSTAGDAQRVAYYACPPPLLEFVVFTFLDWLIAFSVCAVIGIVTALIAARMPRRRRLELTPLPIEVPAEFAGQRPLTG
jgi:hypothetical protein